MQAFSKKITFNFQNTNFQCVSTFIFRRKHKEKFLYSLIYKNQAKKKATLRVAFSSILQEHLFTFVL